MATENLDNEEATKTEDMSSFNPIDCPAGGPVFSDQASEEACPVCKEVEVDAKAGDNGHQEGGEAEMLAALGWESYFDRYGRVALMVFFLYGFLSYAKGIFARQF